MSVNYSISPGSGVLAAEFRGRTAVCNHVHVASQPTFYLLFSLLPNPCASKNGGPNSLQNGGRLPALLPSLSSFSAPFDLVKFSNTRPPLCRYSPLLPGSALQSAKADVVRKD